MPIPKVEKHFLEKLAEILPGVRGYHDRESMRETDRRLREYLASRIEEGRHGLDAIRRAAVARGDLAPLDVVGRLDRSLQKMVAGLRYADAGYSGAFDSVKIGERELSRVHAFDETLLAEVDAVADDVRASAARFPEAGHLETLERRVAELDELVARRRELFDAPIA